MKVLDIIGCSMLSLSLIGSFLWMSFVWKWVAKKEGWQFTVLMFLITFAIVGWVILSISLFKDIRGIE